MRTVVEEDALIARIGHAAKAHSAAMPVDVVREPALAESRRPHFPPPTLDPAPERLRAPPPEPAPPADRVPEAFRPPLRPEPPPPAVEPRPEVYRAPPRPEPPPLRPIPEPFRTPQRPEPAPSVRDLRARTGFRVPTPDVSPPGGTAYERAKGRALGLFRTGLRYAVYAVGGYLALVLVLIVAYRFVDPPFSTLMLIRSLGGDSIERTWTPLERISPHLVRAVVVAEDGQFCRHWGIDLGAIKEAIENAGDGVPRGASTISMQVIKNLFLWPAKSYVRKAVEVPLTIVSELVWQKSRILEIYLNVAEWGPGIFGAEAAARRHFNKSAARLSDSEAALLAASLPNPAVRDPGDPGPRTSRKARVILARMHASPSMAACVAGQ